MQATTVRSIPVHVRISVLGNIGMIQIQTDTTSILALNNLQYDDHLNMKTLCIIYLIQGEYLPSCLTIF